MSTDFGYCHPQWPEEKRYIKSEIARIRGMQGSKNSGWAYYEWLTVLGLMCVIIIQVIYAIKPSQPVGTAAKFVYLVELFLLWIRLLKPMRSVPAMASLIVILSKSEIMLFLKLKATSIDNMAINIRQKPKPLQESWLWI